MLGNKRRPRSGTFRRRVDQFGYQTNCHCGHDRASHYVEQKGTPPAACLARGCDCKKYVNDREPKADWKAAQGRRDTWPGGFTPRGDKYL
jgi:hypothetical protein